MTITKTIVLKERKNDWALQIKVDGAKGKRPVVTLATFIKRPMGLIAVAASFNHMAKTMMADYQEVHATRDGLQSLHGVGIELTACAQLD